MDFEELELALPRVEAWIDEYISAHREAAVPLTTRGFSRLGLYFSPNTLQIAQVAYVPKVVTPPLGQLGISGFNDFEYGSYEGITYKDFVFIDSSRCASESLHFHEAVHIVQWRELGYMKFLLLYAKGLAEDGYRNCVLEVMAYQSQKEFDKGTLISDFEMKVAQMVRHEAEEAGFG
ncbi:MAG: hypothetical protein NTW55_06160 [Planctomycetota bacterium]|nr:hypothetical protein [Planctomycetota bacterium]